MKIFKLWLPVIIWAGLIFYISNIPHLKTSLEYDFILRKIAHIIEYFILTFLLHRAFKGSFDMDGFSLFIYSTALLLCYAASDEFHQLFVPGRGGSIRDVAIDAIGIFGFYVVRKICTVKQKQEGGDFLDEKEYFSIRSNLIVGRWLCIYLECHRS